MDRSVQLDHLPEGIEFPSDLQPRIKYDPQRRALSFQGFMSKSEFDRLSRLHNDYLYQRSLERLFQQCTFVTDPQPSFPAIKAFLGSIAVLCGLALVIGFWKIFH